ncbi:MAG: hypothetical protein NTU50_02670 [Actinobacteria bacterium]|nr:hypothetical protein [Actinomycetota bacterium]
MSKWVLVVVWAGTAALATAVGVGALSFVAGGIDIKAPLVAVQENSPSVSPAATSAPGDTASKDDPAQVGGQTSSGNTTGGSTNTRPQQSSGSNSSSADSNKPRPSKTSSPTVQLKSISVAGGSATLQCTNRIARLIAYAPADGFVVESVDRGPGDDVRVRFQSDVMRWEIKGECEDSGPVFETESDELG